MLEMTGSTKGDLNNVEVNGQQSRAASIILHLLHQWKSKKSAPKANSPNKKCERAADAAPANSPMVTCLACGEAIEAKDEVAQCKMCPNKVQC